MKDAWEFRLVECSGTPYEIGLQWGAACKDSIASSSKTSLDRMASFLQFPGNRFSPWAWSTSLSSKNMIHTWSK